MTHPCGCLTANENFPTRHADLDRTGVRGRHCHPHRRATFLPRFWRCVESIPGIAPLPHGGLGPVRPGSSLRSSWPMLPLPAVRRSFNVMPLTGGNPRLYRLLLPRRTHDSPLGDLFGRWAWLQDVIGPQIKAHGPIRENPIFSEERTPVQERARPFGTQRFESRHSGDAFCRRSPRPWATSSALSLQWLA